MLPADLIIAGLRAAGKKQAFQAVAEAAAPLFFGAADDVFNALLERERLGSTAIGGGAAIPHVKIAGIDRMYGVIACLERPIDFDSPDGQPVDIIFLLIAPAESKTTLHLKALAQVSRFLKNPEICLRLRASAGREEIGEVVESWVKSQAA